MKRSLSRRARRICRLLETMMDHANMEKITRKTMMTFASIVAFSQM